MNIDRLIDMANQISSFFAAESLPGRASADVATHLRRYWEPRMRAQIVTYYREGHGAGLGAIALGAVALLVDPQCQSVRPTTNVPLDDSRMAEEAGAKAASQPPGDARPGETSPGGGKATAP